MATQTANLGLTKPGYDEAADIVPAVNNNMDTLDSKIGAVPANSSVQGQLDSHNQAIGNLANLTTTEKGSLVGAANELNSKISNRLVANEIPYSNFTWDAENKRYSYQNPDLGVSGVIGFICRATNGNAIMAAYLTSNGSRIDVIGWIPVSGDSIDSNYQFKLYAVGYN